jgi:hypothetical protein
MPSGTFTEANADPNFLITVKNISDNRIPTAGHKKLPKLLFFLLESLIYQDTRRYVKAWKTRTTKANSTGKGVAVQ